MATHAEKDELRSLFRFYAQRFLDAAVAVTLAPWLRVTRTSPAALLL